MADGDWRSLLILESITGGAVDPATAPPSLWQEGLAMRNALRADAEALGLEVAVAMAAGEADPPDHSAMLSIEHRQRWRDWRGAMQASESVIVVAPETAGCLLRLSTLALACRRRLLGSNLNAIGLAGSKRLTARRLAAHGVPVVPTYSLDEFRAALRSEPGWVERAWVLKPDDGVGGMGCRRIESDLVEALMPVASDYCIQPLVSGLCGSLSLLVWRGVTWVLARNRQDLEWQATGVALKGLDVNAWALDWVRATQLAEAVVQALPGLSGLCGIDVLETPTGELRVVEVNPRVTSAYPGLARSLGQNPLALLRQVMSGEVPCGRAWQSTCQPVCLGYAALDRPV